MSEVQLDIEGVAFEGTPKARLLDMSTGNRVHAPSQAAVLEFIKAEIASGHGFPSDQAICDHMGWAHPSSARDALMALGANRLLRPVSRQPYGRGWRYTWEIAA